MVIQQHITDTNEHWHIVIGEGGVERRDGVAADATVTLTTDHATAAAIANGTESARRAFLDGRLRLGGDVDALLRVADRLPST